MWLCQIIHVDGLFNWHVVVWRRISLNQVGRKLCPHRNTSEKKNKIPSHDEYIRKNKNYHHMNRTLMNMMYEKDYVPNGIGNKPIISHTTTKLVHLGSWEN